MPTFAMWRTALVRAGLCALVLVPGGCGDQGTSGDEVAVYSAAIRWLVNSPRNEDRGAVDRTVYVEAVVDHIQLEVQVGLLKALEDLARLRFIDDPREAVDTAQPGAPVRGNGLLVGLGAVTATTPDHVNVYVDLYRNRDQVVAYELVLDRTHGRWRVVGTPDPTTVRAHA